MCADFTPRKNEPNKQNAANKGNNVKNNFGYLLHNSLPLSRVQIF